VHYVITAPAYSISVPRRRGPEKHQLWRTFGFDSKVRRFSEIKSR
jgi:hypothetical protein